jgi:hypothetical protein
MPLAPGSRIGSHVVLSLIGAGGIGEVYRARDTTLDRDVAIKRLPDAVVNGAVRLARFEREAKTLLLVPAGQQQAPPLEVIVNWPALVTK